MNSIILIKSREAKIEDALKNSNRIEVFDIKKLLKEKVSYLSSSLMWPYGIPYHLKKFAGLNTNILLNNCSIEHGVYFSRLVCQIEVTHYVSRILTFSPFREEVIKELTNLEPCAIGPYIAYVKNYRSEEEITEKKKRIGHALLVMPAHSTQEDVAEYNIGEFIQQIESVKKGFDTVLVCMHFEDMKRGLWKLYKDKGYCIVSAGNIESPYFLNRLKYIISLSDAVVMNAVTTGMAYAMYMNRPVRVISQQVKHKVIGCNNSNDFELESQVGKAYEIFNENRFVITREQKIFGDYVFGLENVKSKEEMRKLLLTLTRTMQV